MVNKKINNIQKGRAMLGRNTENESLTPSIPSSDLNQNKRQRVKKKENIDDVLRRMFNLPINNDLAEDGITIRISNIVWEAINSKRRRIIPESEIEDFILEEARERDYESKEVNQK